MHENQTGETVFIRDIETRVFQAIVMQCINQIDGVSLLEGTFFDTLLGRELDHVKGIVVDQDSKKNAVEVRVEVAVAYGLNIPAKAEEVQLRIVEEIVRWTHLRVSSVHVIFKDLIFPTPQGASAPVLEEVF
jgi:uncharacterized alkaline shock family protein YloU